jgi:hypothetical protein
MGELIASSMSVPLSGRLSRLALSPVCLSAPPVTSATPTLPPTFTRTSSRRHRGDKHRAPDSTGSTAALLGSAAAGFHDLAQLPRDRPRSKVYAAIRAVDDMRHIAACRAALVALPNAPPGRSWSCGWPFVLSRHYLVAESTSPHTRRPEKHD